MVDKFRFFVIIIFRLFLASIQILWWLESTGLLYTGHVCWCPKDFKVAQARRLIVITTAPKYHTITVDHG